MLLFFIVRSLEIEKLLPKVAHGPLIYTSGVDDARWLLLSADLFITKFTLMRKSHIIGVTN